MQTDTMFYVAWIALAFEIIWAINTARLAKKQELLSPMVAPAAIAFTLFHVCWWISAFKPGENIFAYVIGSLASMAFLFGTSFVTTGCMKLTDKGELCINKDNKAFKIVSKLPIKFDGRSLCSISWLAAICIFLLPIIMSVFAVVLAAVTLVICAWTFQNPWEYYKEIIKLEGWPETRVERAKNGWWVSPTPYMAGIALVVGILVMIVKYLPIVAISVTSVLAVWALLLLLSGIALKKWAQMAPEQQNQVDKKVYYAMTELQDEPNLRPINIWVVFWQVFKQKFCPSIKYCDEDEMRYY